MIDEQSAPLGLQLRAFFRIDEYLGHLRGEGVVYVSRVPVLRHCERRRVSHRNCYSRAPGEYRRGSEHDLGEFLNAELFQPEGAIDSVGDPRKPRGKCARPSIGGVIPGGVLELSREPMRCAEMTIESARAIDLPLPRIIPPEVSSVSTVASSSAPSSNILKNKTSGPSPSVLSLWLARSGPECPPQCTAKRPLKKTSEIPDPSSCLPTEVGPVNSRRSGKRGAGSSCH